MYFKLKYYICAGKIKQNTNERTFHIRKNG